LSIEDYASIDSKVKKRENVDIWKRQRVGIREECSPALFRIEKEGETNLDRGQSRVREIFFSYPVPLNN